MRRGVGAILFVAAITAACSGSSTAPSSTPSAQSAASLGAGTSTQATGSGVEITGTVDALPPATAAATFTVAGKMVATNASTVFADSGFTRSFDDLKVGSMVEVHGTMSGNTITATRVDIEHAAIPNPSPEPEPDPEPEPHAPTPPVANPPAPNPPSTVSPSPGDGDDHDNEVEAEGTLGAVVGACPSISSAVGVTKFTTNASTRFDDVACTALQTGSKVQVKGTRNADGSLTAMRVKRD